MLLTVLYNNDQKRRHAFHPSEFKKVRVGRNSENEVFLKLFTLSRVHMTFDYDETEMNWVARDGDGKVKSTNGTWLLIDAMVEINDSLLFKLGKSIFSLGKCE